jgi:hypothetical protein
MKLLRFVGGDQAAHAVHLGSWWSTEVACGPIADCRNTTGCSPIDGLTVTYAGQNLSVAFFIATPAEGLRVDWG